MTRKDKINQARGNVLRAMQGASPERKQLLVFANGRLARALQYGEDMATSADLCLLDAYQLIAQARAA